MYWKASFLRISKNKQNSVKPRSDSILSNLIFLTLACKNHLNPLPDMPILSSSNSAAIKDMASKIWTNEDTII